MRGVIVRGVVMRGVPWFAGGLVCAGLGGCKEEIGGGGESESEAEAEAEGDACDAAGCDPVATCEVVEGEPLCACPDGYDGDGRTCDDVDECETGAAGCDENASCANSAGGFTCTCNAGWEGDGASCDDVDECATGADDCDPNAACDNAPGSFGCGCNEGFTGDGRLCQQPALVLVAGQSDADLVAAFAAARVPVPPDADFSPVDAGAGGVILVGDSVMIGIARRGELNPSVAAAPLVLGWDSGTGDAGEVSLPAMDCAFGCSAGFPGGRAGLAYRADPADPFEEDVLSPGCACEGWGVRFSGGGTPYEGGATQGFDSLSDATSISFETAYDDAEGAWLVRAVAAVGPLEVTVVWSLRRGDAYAAQRIVLANTGGATLALLRFARSADFDVGPGHYDGDAWDFLYDPPGPPDGPWQLVRATDLLDDLGTTGDEGLGPSDNFFAAGSASPSLTCADGITYFSNDPDYLVVADSPSVAGPDCGTDPADVVRDGAASFVYEPPDLAPGASIDL